jgi:hypothetical protein
MDSVLLEFQDRIFVENQPAQDRWLVSSTLVANKVAANDGLNMELNTYKTSLECAACRNGDTFQYYVAYANGDLSNATFSSSIRSPHDCCLECEEHKECMYWTFNNVDLQCRLINSRERKLNFLMEATSGRVSLDKFLARQVTVGYTEAKIACSFDAEDKPFLQPWFNSNSNQKGGRGPKTIHQETRMNPSSQSPRCNKYTNFGVENLLFKLSFGH